MSAKFNELFRFWVTFCGISLIMEEQARVYGGAADLYSGECPCCDAAESEFIFERDVWSLKPLKEGREMCDRSVKEMRQKRERCSIKARRIFEKRERNATDMQKKRKRSADKAAGDLWRTWLQTDREELKIKKQEV